MTAELRIRALACLLALALPPLAVCAVAARLLAARFEPLAGGTLLLCVLLLLLAPRIARGLFAGEPAPPDGRGPLLSLPDAAPLLVGASGTRAASAGLLDRLSEEQRAVLLAREAELLRLPGGALAALHALLSAALSTVAHALASPLGRGPLATLLLRGAHLLDTLLSLPFRSLHAAREREADLAAIASGASAEALLAALEGHLFACVADLTPAPATFRQRLLARLSPFATEDLRDVAISLEYRDLIRRDRILPYLVRALHVSRTGIGRPFAKAHPGRRAVALLRLLRRDIPAHGGHARLDDLVVDRLYRLLPGATLLVCLFAVAVSRLDRFTAGISCLFLGLSLLLAHRERYSIGAPFLKITIAELKSDPAVGSYAGVPAVIEARRILPDARGGAPALLLSDGEAAIPLTVSLAAPPPRLSADHPFLAVGYFRRDDHPRFEALALPGCEADLFTLSPRAKRFAGIALLLACGCALTLASLR